MPLGNVLVHVGIPQREESTPEYVEGEPASTEPTPGTPFDCFLIFNRGGSEEESKKGSRVIQRPSLLFEPFDVTGADFMLKASEKVEITAPELLGADAVLFQVDGDPTPFAKPGFLVGYEAALKRVRD